MSVNKRRAEFDCMTVLPYEHKITWTSDMVQNFNSENTSTVQVTKMGHIVIISVPGMKSDKVTVDATKKAKIIASHAIPPQLCPRQNVMVDVLIHAKDSGSTLHSTGLSYSYVDSSGTTKTTHLLDGVAVLKLNGTIEISTKLGSGTDLGAFDGKAGFEPFNLIYTL